jgi:hypothetical protein
MTKRRAGEQRIATPPLNAKTWRIAPLVIPSARAMSLAHWPLFQRAQRSARFSPDTLGRPIFARRAPPSHKLDQKMLRRSVGPAAEHGRCQVDRISRIESESRRVTSARVDAKNLLPTER